MVIDSKNISRAYSRLMAVQIFYSFLVTGNYSTEKLDENINYFITDAPIKNKGVKFDGVFIKSLITRALEEKEKIHDIINTFTTKHKLNNKSDKLLEAILIIAITEYFLDITISKKVLISEYNNITSEFYDDESVKFINAILNQVFESGRE
jgi:transcription termination factor NusB